MNTLLSFQDVEYHYHTISGETQALKNISFSVHEGEFLSIVGPSGCGKTTLLPMIAGLIKPESGELHYADTLKNNPSGIGYMLQHDHLFEWRTIYKNVLLGLELRHKNTKERRKAALDLLSQYGLYPFRDSYPDELSGGMRQRAALIRTLVCEPELLLLDEPFSALDYQTRLTVSSDIAEIIKKEKKTAVLVTHDLSEAVALSDRILVLSARPAYVLRIMDIHLTKQGTGAVAARKAPEFSTYFNELWEELHGKEQSTLTPPDTI